MHSLNLAIADLDMGNEAVLASVVQAAAIGLFFKCLQK